MELDQITEIIKTSIKDAYDKGFVDGSTKQAILELQGRDRFLEELRASQPANAADAESRCAHDYVEIQAHACTKCGHVRR